MAWSVWSRFESTSFYRNTKLIIKRLAGDEMWVRVKHYPSVESCGGWSFVTDRIGPQSVIYSLGIGEDASFDEEVIEKFNARVYAFDPTPSTLEWIKHQDMPDNFIFNPWAISQQDGTLKFYPRAVRGGKGSDVMYTLIPEAGLTGEAIEVPAWSLQSIMKKLGHESIDLMKVDIEGAEYEVLESMLDSGIYPHQLLVEFHHRFPGIGLKKTRQITKRLKQAGYCVSAVTYTGREISFIRSDSEQTQEKGTSG